MKFTKKNLKKLFKLGRKLRNLNERVSANLNFVKKKNGDNKIKVKQELKDKDGNKKEREVKLKEKEIWKEIYHIGEAANGYDELREKYPKLFEMSDKSKELAKKYQSYVYETFGVDYKKMKFTDLVKVSKAMMKYQITRLIPILVVLQIAIAITVFVVI